MAFGLESYSSNGGALQLDAGVQPLTWQRAAPANGSVGRSFHWISYGGGRGLSVYGDYQGMYGGDELGLQWESGELLAINIPTGSAINQVGAPNYISFTDNYYLTVQSTGTSNPNLSGHVYKAGVGSTSGFGLVIYNTLSQPIFTSNQWSANVVGLIDIHPNSSNLTVTAGRNYAGIFLNPSIACYRATPTRLDFYGIRRSSSTTISVEFMYSQSIASNKAGGLPLTSSYKALILDVTGL